MYILYIHVHVTLAFTIYAYITFPDTINTYVILVCIICTYVTCTIYHIIYTYVCWKINNALFTAEKIYNFFTLLKYKVFLYGIVFRRSIYNKNCIWIFSIHSVSSTITELTYRSPTLYDWGNRISSIATLLPMLECSKDGELY